MGYISAALMLVGFGLLLAKKHKAALVTFCFAGLFGAGTWFVRS